MRAANELRPVKVKRGYTSMSPGSVLYEAGNTVVLCTASVEKRVPDWLAGKRHELTDFLLSVDKPNINPPEPFLSMGVNFTLRRGMANAGLEA